ncbi:MAG: hypothetical protein U9N60_10215 [Thermodesulfobacteriota bacterium]|nr:hypothetical protein [Thermodesulfobacteriota bacterium]
MTISPLSARLKGNPFMYLTDAFILRIYKYYFKKVKVLGCSKYINQKKMSSFLACYEDKKILQRNMKMKKVIKTNPDKLEFFKGPG